MTPSVLNFQFWQHNGCKFKQWRQSLFSQSLESCQAWTDFVAILIAILAKLNYQNKTKK
jgi:hypothetical protein